MPPEPAPHEAAEDLSHAPKQKEASFIKDLFSVPLPVKKLFDLVPLVTYSPNQLPQRSPKSSRIPSLYIFSTDHDAAAGRPSFNPSCLKWQTFLNIAGVHYRLVSSNNHASPTGALPFLLPPAQSNPAQDALPVPSNKILKYATDHGGQIREPSGMRYEAYQSLLDHRIRNAWLYTLYLSPGNFSSIAAPLYIHPASSNPLVRLSLSHSLRSAAAAELLKQSAVIDANDLHSEADKAFEALSSLLGADEWFFGEEAPTLFDASVFAYTQLLLDERLQWADAKLSTALRRRANLVAHRERVLGRYYGR
ncbi:hypothetical protein OIDMADRAFT_113924 [Oidiodendron maius Zn]|uniref:Thioredoxin-like fold domain-containing protein n=1 Tax=Oidiodendron maius (strain Zn) TaxID=913774 RepID=A0A0C3HTG2_OIDMZ|nr:hypothetical protein OIDMADRAFT_113924 [Oidiodendron maius Zn]